MKLDELLEAFKFLASPFNDPTTFNVRHNDKGKRNVTVTATSPDIILRTITDFCLNYVNFMESSIGLQLQFDFNSDRNNDGDSYDDSSSIIIPSDSQRECPSWKLTCVILALLSELKSAIEQAELEQTEEEKAIDVLSIQSQIIVQKSVELVVGFGISPYLLPGVGVPEKLRKMNPCALLFLTDVMEATPYEQFLRLSHTLEILLTCSGHPSLFTLIVPKYASDILAGLLQVCKSPIARPKNEIEESDDGDGNNGALTIEQYENVMRIRANHKSLLENIFFANIPKSTLINSLFLIGAAEKPRWIGNSCNKILRQIILSPNGLIMVASTMTESSRQFDTWKLMRVISSLMKGALEKSTDPKSHETLRTLSEQCIQMILQEVQVQDDGRKEEEESHHQNEAIMKDDRQKKSAATDKEHISSLNLPYGSNIELMRIGLFCGITLLSVDFKFVKSVFWDRLFYHVLLLDTCQQQNQAKLDWCVASKSTISSSNSNEIFITAQKASMSIAVGELLLSVLKPMNVSLPLKLLQPVWSLFLQIFVACERYLKKPVQEPNVAAVAEQLHHKLRDVLITLYEVYSSGLGFTLELSSSSSSSSYHTPQNQQKKSNSKQASNSTSAGVFDRTKYEKIDLCDFTLMLVLNQGGSNSDPVCNSLELLAVSEDLGVCIVRVHQEIVSPSSDYNKVYDEYLNVTCQYLSSKILKDEKLKGLWAPLIRQLLSWGTKRHGKSSTLTATTSSHKKFKSDEMPNYIDGSDMKVNVVDCKRFITFKLLGELGTEETILEQFGNSENAEETLDFLELLLNKFTEEACTNSEDDDGFNSSQLVMYALGIIGAIAEAASSATVSTENSSNQSQSTGIQEELIGMWDSLQIFIPHLRKLSQCTQPALVRQGIPEMASGLLLNIGTRGKDYRQSKRNLLFSRFQQAMEDSLNPMIHIKGHGLLELKRLIEEKDKETLENGVEVLKVFQHNLKNDDSYIYLMSIQGMAAFALKFHNTVVPTLIKEYDFVSSDHVGDSSDSCVNDTAQSGTSQLFQKLDPEESIETRMKVGEILVKVIQKLGQIAPNYRVPLTNVFFRLMRDYNPLIRASALSNLGELCHLLKFSLGIILTEVWYCVESILNTEKDIHVRRAALHLIVLMLKGVATEFSAADILNDTIISQHLRDVRRHLTRVEQMEVDLVAKTHSQLALQELELIVRKLLTPSNPLDFKLQMLNL